MNKAALAVLAVVLSAARAAAQEAPIAACLFPTVALTEGEETASLSDIVGRALAQNLHQLGIEVLPEAAWRQALGGVRDEALTDGRTASEVAARAGARMAVVSLVHLDGRQLAMGVRVIDARSGRVVSSVYSTTLVGVAVHNRITDAVSRLTPQLESFLRPEQQVEDLAPFVVEATLLSDLDGTRISLAGVEPVGEIVNGRLTLPFALYPAGTKLEVVSEKEGYHTARETIVLDKSRSEARLEPLWRETRRSVHLSWTTGQALGIGLGYRHYLTPDTLFLAAESYIYFQPEALAGSDGLAFHNDLGFLVGRYLFSRYDARVRFALAAGLGVILSKTGSPGLFTDWYLDVGSVNLEWNLRQYTIALRSDAKATTGIGNDLLGTGVMILQRFGPQITVSLGRKL